jgi:hypothetical protein
MGDHGYIGEELLGDNPEYELERKCLVVYQSVRDDYFSLDEALKAYEVSREDYEDFIERNLLFL